MQVIIVRTQFEHLWMFFRLYIIGIVFLSIIIESILTAHASNNVNIKLVREIKKSRSEEKRADFIIKEEFNEPI